MRRGSMLMAEPEYLDNTAFQLCPKCGKARPDVLAYPWRDPSVNPTIQCPSCGLTVPETYPHTAAAWNALGPAGFLDASHGSEPLHACAHCGAAPSMATDPFHAT